MRQLTEADVTITVEIDEETDHYSSEIFGYDKEVQDAFQAMIDKHGLWGWCSVCVTASWRGISASTYLGTCSYENEEAFRADDYYKTLVHDAVAELNAVVRDWFAEVDEARSELELTAEEAQHRRALYRELRWKNPIWCPHCKADLRDHKNGVPFKRSIAVYSREQDRTAHWKCPDCEGTWDRS